MSAEPAPDPSAVGRLLRRVGRGLALIGVAVAAFVAVIAVVEVATDLWTSR